MISSGVPTRKARDEIVNALSTLIMVHTIRPSSEDYTIICKKLVEKHPTLKDSLGSGYVILIICVILGLLEEKVEDEIKKFKETS